MRIGVILSTYNAPQRLEATLLGYSVQSRRDFELIVADDGSGEETRELIRSFAHRFGQPIRHVWQEDIGFRKCRILNQAILCTQADYLIFSDGDCIPRRDFVTAHATAATAGRFLSAGYFRLSAATTAAITVDDICAGRPTDVRWLRSHGTRKSGKLAKLSARGWRASLFNTLTPTKPTWNGHNSSGWRTDLLRVNGFDERMGYWAEDRELGERLENAGIRGKQIRYSAICVHLHHDRPYATPEGRERNKRIRQQTRRAHAVWTEQGIFKGPRAEDRSVAPGVAADVAVRTYQMF